MSLLLAASAVFVSVLFGVAIIYSVAMLTRPKPIEVNRRDENRGEK